MFHLIWCIFLIGVFAWVYVGFSKNLIGSPGIRCARCQLLQPRDFQQLGFTSVSSKWYFIKFSLGTLCVVYFVFADVEATLGRLSWNVIFRSPVSADGFFHPHNGEHILQSIRQVKRFSFNSWGVISHLDCFQAAALSGWLKIFRHISSEFSSIAAQGVWIFENAKRTCGFTWRLLRCHGKVRAKDGAVDSGSLLSSPSEHFITYAPTLWKLFPGKRLSVFKVLVTFYDIVGFQQWSSQVLIFSSWALEQQLYKIYEIVLFVLKIVHDGTG